MDHQLERTHLMEWASIPAFFVLWVLLAMMWGASPREAITESVLLSVPVLIVSWICLHAIQ